MTRNLLSRLAQAQSDDERTWLVTENLLEALPSDLQSAVWAVAVPHCFNENILAAMLPNLANQSETLYRQLQQLSFVEVFRGRGYNIHERTRKILLEKLWQSRQNEYIQLSQKASHFFEDLPATWQKLEFIYHSVIAEPDYASNIIWTVSTELNNTFQYIELDTLANILLEHVLSHRLAPAAEAVTFYLKGGAAFRSNKNIEALDSYKRAIFLFHEVGDRLGEANTVKALEDTQHFLAKSSEALKNYEWDSSLIREVGDRSAAKAIIFRESLIFYPKMRYVKILSLLINNVTLSELLKDFTEGICFTPNVDHLIELERDREFREAYQYADYKICNSKILFYVSKFLGNPIKQKISGSDFFPAFCRYHRFNPDIKIYLLGGAEGSASQAQLNINREIGRNIVVGSRTPSFGFERNEEECLSIVEEINRIRPTVLAIGVGAPKQEKWIVKYKNMMPNVKIFLAIGATIDFEARNTSRAPQWVSQAGLEWLYREWCEPRRLWRRYFVNDLPILLLILRQKFGIYREYD